MTVYSRVLESRHIVVIVRLDSIAGVSAGDSDDQEDKDALHDDDWCTNTDEREH
jgi:hypothetical protein